MQKEIVPMVTAVPALHPTQFVIFGITGDLASRKLLPALLTLYAKKLLPPRFSIIGFSRRSFTREEFREYIRDKMHVKPGEFPEEVVKHFLDHLTYEQGMFDDPRAYSRLADRLKGTDDRWGQCSNKLFHLSVPPTLYEGILNQVASSGLSEACADETGWTRVLIEKPFGNDIETARSLDKLLGKLFKEEQIFRIDHYLAKEALQNILAFRFTNTIFEPLWNREHIDKIHIKLFEKMGMDGRGAFYDPIGALKDVGQNHILQMLALVTMERPKQLTSLLIRKERAKVLEKLKAISKKQLSSQAVKGQYVGYTEEAGVNPKSETETYFRIRTLIDSPRWKGVPIYLESGKGFAESKAEIDVYFKADKGSDRDNILTFRIQPDQGIKIRFFVKTPGYGFNVESKVLKFKYSETQSFMEIPDDYERLIHDAVVGDQTLFASTDEIMASWAFVTELLKGWSELPLTKYERGVREID
jgi:glucose-6-phosphate 1-dehydrogenase